MTKQQKLVLWVSILASMVAAIDGFIVNVALPAISKDLGGGLAVTSWRWIFAVNVVPIALTVWLLAKLREPERPKTDTPIDTLGAVLCAIGLGAPVFALIEQPAHGWGSPLVWAPLVVGLTVLALFVWYERRNPAPMLPLSLFKIRNFSWGNLATLAIYAALPLATFILAIALQQVGGYTPLEASLAMLPVTVVMFLLSGKFGALAGKFGPRWFMAAGPVMGAIGFLLMLLVQPDVQYATQLLPGILVFALGLTMTVAPLTSAVLGDVGKAHAGVASAVNNAVARIAGLIAIATVGVITGPTLDIHGLRRVLIVSAALMVTCGVVSAIGIVNRHKPVD